MFLYADPHVCPACRHDIDRTRPTCATCGVRLLGEPARRTFEALRQVDLLVAELPLQATVQPDEPDVLLVEPPPRVEATRSALSAASVPKILLGLGALCLLVASIVFLVVAWAALGVGGRTGVLAGFTAVAALLMVWVARRGLRAGTEAFSAVVLGLLVIDLGGAREAGWLGAVDVAWFVVLTGSVVALTATAIALWARRTPVFTLVSAEVFGILAVAATAAGVVLVPSAEHDVESLLVATLVCTAASVAARWTRLHVLTVGTRIEVVLTWLLFVATATERLVPPSVAHVWLDLAVWPTLVGAALAALVATRTHLPLWSRVTAAGAGVAVAVLAVTVVSLDESATTLALVELAVVAASLVVASVIRVPSWRWVVVLPSVVAALALGGSAVMLVVEIAGTVAPSGVWVSAATVGLSGPDIPWSWPLLLPAAVVGICASAGTVLTCRDEDPRVLVVPGAALTVAAVALVPALYGVPLVAAVVVMVLAATGLGTAALLTGRAAVGVPAAVLLATALTTGLANAWTTAMVLVVTLAAALVAERHPQLVMNALGLALTPSAVVGLVWTLGELAGVPEPWRAVPVIVLLGVSVLLRPGTEREGLHLLAAAVAVAGSVVTDQATLLAGWLAVDLTLVGVVATGSALVHPARRHLARVGLALFALAHWVRLHDVGVGTVEAYTLPLAVVLLVVGCVSLARRDDPSVRALGPGLGLALVPSLLMVLEDPVGLRALLLGAACLVLVAIGLVGRLAAPLVAGALVGALVVLRQGTLAELLPQWAIIGLVGIGLTVVGITWEQRLQELRRASAYVRGLR